MKILKTENKDLKFVCDSGNMLGLVKRIADMGLDAEQLKLAFIVATLVKTNPDVSLHDVFDDWDETTMGTLIKDFMRDVEVVNG